MKENRGDIYYMKGGVAKKLPLGKPGYVLAGKEKKAKTIKAWAAIAPKPSAYEYLDGVISWSIHKRRRESTHQFRNWKEHYEHGYRVRRIEIRVLED